MGLGKTIQCIAHIAMMIEKKVMGPFLVVAPLSTLPNWISEFNRFTPEVGGRVPETSLVSLRLWSMCHWKFDRILFFSKIVTSQMISLIQSFLSAGTDAGWPLKLSVFISAVATQSELCPVFVPDVCAALPWPPGREGQATEADPQASGVPQHVPCGRHLLWDLHDRQKILTGNICAHPLLNKQALYIPPYFGAAHAGTPARSELK